MLRWTEKFSGESGKIHAVSLATPFQSAHASVIVDQPKIRDFTNAIEGKRRSVSALARRQDGQCLFYRGKRMLCMGEQGSKNILREQCPQCRVGDAKGHGSTEEVTRSVGVQATTDGVVQPIFVDKDV